MTTTDQQPPLIPLPKTPAERLADVFATARAVVDHCDTAPGKLKERFAYSVDKVLVVELKAALKAVESMEKEETRRAERKAKGKKAMAKAGTRLGQ
ncbi:MAG: hypothetical protein GY832_24335 [Chloroflexi bacterium]|nr:hypothetical protein [Chloroflexota bacterium]